MRYFRKWKARLVLLMFLFIFVLLFHEHFLHQTGSYLLHDDISLQSPQLLESRKSLGKDLDAKTATIFLQMPSFGDEACNMTLENAFRKAENPSRLFVGIYQQAGTRSSNRLTECLYFTCDSLPKPAVCDYLDNIRINRTDLKGALGPVYGRYMADSLYDEERDFIIIMDSHLTFRNNWDTYAIDMWKSIQNEYAILTHIPDRASFIDSRARCFDDPTCEENFSYHVCGSTFESNHMPRNSNKCWIKDVKKPVLTPFFAAGFALCRSHIRENVPWDSYQKYLFWGEEFSFSSRAWTHGYDFYSPHKDIVGHWYDRGPKRQSPFISSKRESNKLRKASELRVKYLWNILPKKDWKKAELTDIEKYGLGNKRSLDEFWKFAGIDLNKETTTEFDNEVYRGGGLKYVPWHEEHR